MDIVPWKLLGTCDGIFLRSAISTGARGASLSLIRVNYTRYTGGSGDDYNRRSQWGTDDQMQAMDEPTADLLERVTRRMQVAL
jgi:hypothetical protein